MSKLPFISTNFVMDFLSRSGLPPLASNFELKKILNRVRVVTLFLRCKLRRIEEIQGAIKNISEKICQNLAQILRRIEEIPHIYVLVNLTFTGNEQ